MSKKLPRLELDGKRFNAGNGKYTTQQMSEHLKSLSKSQREKIRVFWLFDNVMTHLPEELWTLFETEKIEILSFFDNRITVLDPRVGNMSLTWLYGQRNDLVTLPSSISRLTQLQNVDLRGNNRLPEEFQVTLHHDSQTTIQELLQKVSKFYRRLELRYQNCLAAARAVLAIRRKSELWARCVPRELARLIARMILDSNDNSLWDQEKA